MLRSLERRQQITTVECLLEEAQRLSSEVVPEGFGARSQDRGHIVEILCPTREDLHGNDVFGACDRHTDGTDLPYLRAFEKQLFDARACEHYVHWNSARCVNRWQDARAPHEVVIIHPQSEASCAERFDERSRWHVAERYGHVHIDGQAWRTMHRGRLSAEHVPTDLEAIENVPEIRENVSGN